MIEFVTQVVTLAKVFINKVWPEGIFTANCCLFGLKKKVIVFSPQNEAI